MKGKAVKRMMVLALTISMAFVLVPAFAQDKPGDKMVEDNMEILKQELENLHVRSAKLIEDYIDNRKTMTDESAKNLLSNFVTIESDHVNLMKSYLPRFESALAGIKTSRYYQIENKVRAVLQYELARQIPLVQ